MDGPSYHFQRRCDMAAQRIVMGLAVLMCLGLSSSLPCAAETSQVDSATKQVESGARQVGRGVADTPEVWAIPWWQALRSPARRFKTLGKPHKPRGMTP